MIALTVTHGPLVQPELFGDVVTEEGHELLPWDIRTQGAPPAEGYDAVLRLRRQAERRRGARVPVAARGVPSAPPLGRQTGRRSSACASAPQTLAHALGGVVDRVAPAPLAGFYETGLTTAGIEDPVLGVLPEQFEAMNANAYRFTLPAGAVELARGPVTQAFRIGRHARGVQFHPEVRHAQAMAWFSAESRELRRPLDQIERELADKLPRWQEHGRALCRAFLGSAGQRSTGRSS